MHSILPRDSRPQCLYTRIPRPAQSFHVSGRETSLKLPILPSVSLVYTNFPSRHVVCSIPTSLSIATSAIATIRPTIRHRIAISTQQPRLLPGSLRTQETAGADYIWNNTSTTACGWITFYSAVIFLRQPLIQFLSASRPAQLQAAPLLRQTGRSIRPDRSCLQS